MTDSLSNEDVHRTAPATPGLLITSGKLSQSATVLYSLSVLPVCHRLGSLNSFCQSVKI